MNTRTAAAPPARAPAPPVAFWDRIAPRYARDPIRNMAAYEATLDDVISRLSGTDRVLEVGCGTGTTALRLAPAVGHLTATDASTAMIGIARDKTAVRRPSNLTFTIAGAEAPGEPDEMPFDAVLAFNLLHLVPNLPATLAALHRRLRPGGLFISKSACIGDMNPIIRLALPVMRAVGKAPHVLVFDAPALQAAIVRAGFTVEVSRTFPGSPHARYIVARR